MRRKRQLRHEPLELRELLSVRESDVFGDFGALADESAYVNVLFLEKPATNDKIEYYCKTAIQLKNRVLKSAS